MWSYYGSKTNIVDLYPKPMHDNIIEPFAGTARYSLKYFEKNVLLVDKYEVIINIWKWLQQCSPNDILSLPRLRQGEFLSNYKFECQEAENLMGFLIAFGRAEPCNKVTPRLLIRPNTINYSLKRISENLFKIKHWSFKHDSFNNISNDKATWFIDPPYQDGGHIYKHSNKDINFLELANYSKTRNGQVIVCEKLSATWLPFVPLFKGRTQNGTQIEGIYTNYHTHYNNQQQKLIL